VFGLNAPDAEDAMFFRTLVFALLMPLAGLCQTLPKPLSDTVSDFANLLPPPIESRVVAALKEGRKATGVQVVVVTMNHIADYGGAGQRIEDYAKTLFNAWGVGDASRNDGVLILVAKGDRKMRIALGRAYDSVWDNAAQLVIDRDFLPAFRDERYADGIEKGVRGTFEALIKPHMAGKPAPQAKPSFLRENGFYLLFFTGFMAFVLRRQLIELPEKLPILNACPKCGKRGGKVSRSTVHFATKAHSGQGNRHFYCPSCSYVSDTAYVIPMQSASSDSSSSGGFDGGSSSGGGASGDW
jgi:uncharacterized protein